MLTKEMLDNLRSDKNFQQNWRNIFETYPVSIEEFLNSPDYLGSTTLFPKVQFILSEIWKPDIREGFVNLGRGAGKSETAAHFLAVGTYWLMNLKSPHKFYNLSPHTMISLINVGVSLDQASSVIFNNLKGLIENSPWFKGKFTMRKRDVYFESKKIRAISGHSGSTAWRGYHIFASVLDEINFFLDKAGRSNADKMYRVLKGSQDTRFPTAYKLLAISSTDRADDFLDRRIKDLMHGGKVAVI